jgi:DNA-directed RNA polymerase subunit RPC12/RpoP
MLKEYACKNCGYTLLLDEIAIKDYEMQCPSCNTKFVGIIVPPLIGRTGKEDHNPAFFDRS